MIKRIFKVTIDPQQRSAFEADFARISVQVVDSQAGFISVEIGEPTRWNPNEYLMVSHWRDEAALQRFVGEQWDQPYIPQGWKNTS